MYVLLTIIIGLLQLGLSIVAVDISDSTSNDRNGAYLLYGFSMLFVFLVQFLLCREIKKKKKKWFEINVGVILSGISFIIFGSI